LTVNALAAADRVIVPVQAEYYALEGLAQLMRSINLIKARLNERLALGGVLITRSAARTRLSADVEREVRRHFGNPSSRPWSRAPSAWRRRRATASRSPTTTGAHGAPTHTGRWRWSLSNAAEAPRRGLGRGFEVLIGGAGTIELAHVPLEQIHANPRQPRRRFDHETTAGLADSIRHQGIVQPVVLRPRPEGGYELIAGERRWRAAREAGVPTVPAVIREADDRETLLIGLVENVARENLLAGRRGARLLLHRCLRPVARRGGEPRGRSKPAVSSCGCSSSDDVLAMVERGELSEGHARAVLAVPDQAGRRRLARQIVAQGMSVRAAERAARWSGARTKPRTKTPVDPALAARPLGRVARRARIDDRV
jgi:ParB family chromosome partitioning protein